MSIEENKAAMSKGELKPHYNLGSLFANRLRYLGISLILVLSVSLSGCARQTSLSKQPTNNITAENVQYLAKECVSSKNKTPNVTYKEVSDCLFGLHDSYPAAIEEFMGSDGYYNLLRHYNLVPKDETRETQKDADSYYWRQNYCVKIPNDGDWYECTRPDGSKYNHERYY